MAFPISNEQIKEMVSVLTKAKENDSLVTHCVGIHLDSQRDEVAEVIRIFENNMKHIRTVFKDKYNYASIAKSLIYARAHKWSVEDTVIQYDYDNVNQNFHTVVLFSKSATDLEKVSGLLDDVFEANELHNVEIETYLIASEPQKKEGVKV